MTTSRFTSVAVALTALALASSSAPSGAGIAPTVSPARDAQRAPQQARQAEPADRHAYSWPVKPFRVQHPVRGFFGDPRISNHGRGRQFHFGIDISAPNGTPVYATLSGTAYIHALHSTTIAIVGRNDVEFSYWHVVPLVRSGQYVTAYKTVIGHIEEPYGHVHFSEKRGSRYVNPLRPGALGPFSDETRPSVRSAVVDRSGELVVEAYDETPLAVPRPWHDLPVMPALVRGRIRDAKGHTIQGWATLVDFRFTIPSASVFDEVWADGVMQNHVRAPGRYRLVLARNLPPGRYVVEVAVRDTRGNADRVGFRLDVSDR
jgi:Peptidase family M23